MRMRKTCRSVPSLVSFRRCSTRSASSHTTSTTSSEASKRTVRHCLSMRHENRALIPTLTGTGAVYSFDPVGSYEREACRAAGAAQALVQPFLDNQVRYVRCFPILTRLTPVCICYRRYTSRTSKHRRTHHIPYTYRCQTCSLSSLIPSRVRLSVTSRCVLFLKRTLRASR